ncbi:hypothetical protein ERJ75_001759100 [Trypanosoma vivax]|nr:hypothetical protein ERJ75_001759100 [Trypanosoma vivax]
MSRGTKQLCFDFRALGILGALAALLITPLLTASGRAEELKCTNESGESNFTCAIFDSQTFKNCTRSGSENDYYNYNCVEGGGNHHYNFTCSTDHNDTHSYNCTKSGGGGGNGVKESGDDRAKAGGDGGRRQSQGGGDDRAKAGGDEHGPVAEKGGNDNKADPTETNFASTAGLCSMALAIAAHCVLRLVLFSLSLGARRLQ